MNLLLLSRDEVDGEGRAVLSGRRARHLCEVLKVRPGTRLRAGILDGNLGTVEVDRIAGDRVEIRGDFPEVPPLGTRDTLVLAVPRPKALARILEHATALGFAQILLTRSWRVDRSHLGSSILDPATVREHLVAGLEQSRRTRLPVVRLFERFRPFVEDELPALVDGASRFVAHPAAATHAAEVPVEPARPLAVAVGPDGGFIPFEVALLEARGFMPVSLGPHPLRTDAAVVALHSALSVVRELAQPGRSAAAPRKPT